MYVDAPHGTQWWVYIDGLNFHRALRGQPSLNWVDFRALASLLVPRQGTVAGVKYFTSPFSGKLAEAPDVPNRQRLLIRAVRASGVEVIEGAFAFTEAWRSLSSRGEWDDRFRPPLPAEVTEEFASHFASHESRPWKARVVLPQEKFTDVALATHLLRDFYRGDCAHAIIVSNDSDLCPAIEAAVEDGHHVGVFSPMRDVARAFGRTASWSRPMRHGIIERCQMPDEVPVPGTRRVLHRPAAWKWLHGHDRGPSQGGAST